MKKILSLHWGFIPGGVAFYVRQLWDISRYAQIDINNLCITAPKWPIDTLGAETINMKFIKISDRLDPSWIWKLRNILKTEPPDLILTHGFNGAFIAAVAGVGFSIPVVSSWHGDYYPSTRTQKLRKPLFDILLKVLFRTVVKDIVTVSDFSKATLRGKGIDEGRITIIHNGVHDISGSYSPRSPIREELRIPQNNFLVGTACRLVAPKGLEWLLSAISLIVQSRQDINFVIWGDGPQREFLQDLVGKLGVSEYVRFPGYRPDIERCLTALDIFVVSSFAENFSIALLEAMRACLPIVATNVGGNPEAIEDGTHGILVPYADPQALADGIIALANDSALRKRLAVNARQRFLAEFTADKMVDKTAGWLMNCALKYALLPDSQFDEAKQ